MKPIPEDAGSPSRDTRRFVEGTGQKVYGDGDSFEICGEAMALWCKV